MKKISQCFLFVLAAFMLLGPEAAEAFRIIKTDSDIDIKWNTPQATYRINATGGPADSQSVILTSMQTWTDVSTATFTFVNGGTSTSKNFGFQDGVNLIGFGAMGQNGVLAENTFWYSTSTGQIVDSDIEVNTSYPWATDGSPAAYDLQAVVTHELGHALSLDDLYEPSDADKTMYGYGGLGETNARTLHSDDMNGITYLYPAMTLPVPSGLFVYTYGAVLDPAFDADPALSKPFALGDIAGSKLVAHVSFVPFNGLVDIYLGIYAPAADPNVYLINPDGSIQSASGGLVKWRANTRGPVDDFPLSFGSTPLSWLRPGTYYFMAAVAPAGRTDVYYLWSTYFTVP